MPFEFDNMADIIFSCETVFFIRITSSLTIAFFLLRFFVYEIKTIDKAGGVHGSSSIAVSKTKTNTDALSLPPTPTPGTEQEVPLTSTEGCEINRQEFRDGQRDILSKLATSNREGIFWKIYSLLEEYKIKPKEPREWAVGFIEQKTRDRMFWQLADMDVVKRHKTLRRWIGNLGIPCVDEKDEVYASLRGLVNIGCTCGGEAIKRKAEPKNIERWLDDTEEVDVDLRNYKWKHPLEKEEAGAALTEKEGISETVAGSQTSLSGNDGAGLGYGDPGVFGGHRGTESIAGLS